MATLTDLPNEMLSTIARNLQDNVESLHGGYNVSTNSTLFFDSEDCRHPDSDLASLCLVSKRVYPAAAETLYRWPKIPSSTKPVDGSSEVDRKTPLVCLVRTLLERPHFREFIKGIKLLVLPRDAHDSPAIPAKPIFCGTPACFCANTKFFAMLRQVLTREEMRLWVTTRFRSHLATRHPRAVRYNFWQHWMRLLRQGNEPALIGILMLILPELQHLSLRSHAGKRSDSDDEIWGSAEETGIFWDLFDQQVALGAGPFYRPTFLPAFLNLTSLTVNFVLPWSVICLPTLTTLEYEIKDETEDGLFNWAAPHLPISQKPAPVIKTLILNVDICNLGVQDIIQYIPLLLMELTSLHELHFRIFSVPETNYAGANADSDLDLDGFLTRINPSCQELVIDESNVRSDCLFWIRPLAAASYLSFPSLRRLVLPQSMLFEMYDDNLGPLPAPLDTLEVIDSTRALHGWAWRLVNNHFVIPNLNRVVLWCDKNGDVFHPADENLRDVPEWYDWSTGVDPVMVEQQQGLAAAFDEDWKPFDWVGAEVWEVVRAMGAEVVERRRVRGWRALQ
ncbi:hypothetical protein CC80DRAFT_553625 [Byssothecium circinans]|uniref:Uncharacterized protein n=1 Tax=Byssothecium circinans TaxID=147558 RepID=A0A6A5TK83_9PLEO|nr:hypothetical protein CC80DRAFT_553625 [Byssothecium circinans]